MHSIAHTILEQLGGSRFIAMTGARDLVRHDKALSFKLPRGLATNKASHVKITLEPTDTYLVEFLRYDARRLEMKPISRTSGAYADDLARLFTLETGFDTHL